MKKTLFTLGAVALMSTTMLPSPTGYAQTQTQTQTQLSNVNSQIKRINQAIQDNENMINKTEQNIQQSEKELKELQQETKDIQNRVDARNEIIENRLRTLQQEGGNISYLDVLLEAEDFGDFVDRTTAVTTLMEADQDLMKEQEKDLKEKTEKEQAINEELQTLKGIKTDFLGMNTQIEEQKKQSLATKVALEQQQKEQEALAEQVKKEASKKANNEVITKSIASTKNVTPVKTVAKSDEAKSTTTNTTNNATSKKTQTVVTVGNKYIGKSVYVFGGGRNASDIAKGRFDCSGFVSWAFKQVGVSIPAQTDGIARVGKTVTASNMQPGDIVFFDTYKKDGHVGIYVGNGKFIGSQSSSGVAIADMNKGYWKQKFKGHVQRVL